jgi:hypothetical protein
MTKQVAIILVLILVTINVSASDTRHRRKVHRVHHKINFNKFKKKLRHSFINARYKNKMSNYIKIN